MTKNYLCYNLKLKIMVYIKILLARRTDHIRIEPNVRELGC